MEIAGKTLDVLSRLLGVATHATRGIAAAVDIRDELAFFSRQAKKEEKSAIDYLVMSGTPVVMAERVVTVVVSVFASVSRGIGNGPPKFVESLKKIANGGELDKESRDDQLYFLKFAGVQLSAAVVDGLRALAASNETDKHRHLAQAARCLVGALETGAYAQSKVNPVNQPVLVPLLDAARFVSSANCLKNSSLCVVDPSTLTIDLGTLSTSSSTEQQSGPPPLPVRLNLPD